MHIPHHPTTTPLLLSLLLLTSPSLSAPTIHLAGDSTTALQSTTSPNQGWGVFLPSFTPLTVSNRAINGRSARSYTREGRFEAIAAEVVEGDFVVLEFGHNDGGSLTPTDNGRSACGDVSGRCETVYNGVTEIVYTYDAYLVNATKLLQSVGATVIISSQTPNNVWEGGAYAYTPSRFVGLAKQAAERAGVAFVEHDKFVAEAYLQAGGDVVNSWYPVDHTHTSPEGAQVVAKAFAEAVLASESELKEYIQGV